MSIFDISGIVILVSEKLMAMAGAGVQSYDVNTLLVKHLARKPGNIQAQNAGLDFSKHTLFQVLKHFNLHFSPPNMVVEKD